jgi:hypothetical protein
MTDDVARAMDELVELARRLVEESGDGSSFDPEAWVVRYVFCPRASVGEVAPRSLVGTLKGRSLVMRQVMSQQSGAYW